MTDRLRAEIESLRPYLLRYASMQLRNRDAAEDAVQETLVAALAAEGGFAGRSSVRTWLIDAMRRASKERATETIDDEASMESLDNHFDESGHWRDRPQDWPEQALEQRQFLEALKKCLEGLPSRTAQVFLMREHLGVETAEICKELEITSTHCWVLLYRARVALRACLEHGWLGK